MDNIQWTLTDPYVFQTLTGIIGKNIIVQTVQGSVTGVLQDVKPDHIVVNMGGSSFFIRTQQIIWVIPS